MTIYHCVYHITQEIILGTFCTFSNKYMLDSFSTDQKWFYCFCDTTFVLFALAKLTFLNKLSKSFVSKNWKKYDIFGVKS